MFLNDFNDENSYSEYKSIWIKTINNVYRNISNKNFVTNNLFNENEFSYNDEVINYCMPNIPVEADERKLASDLIHILYSTLSALTSGRNIRIFFLEEQKNEWKMMSIFIQNILDDKFNVSEKQISFITLNNEKFKKYNELGKKKRADLYGLPNNFPLVTFHILTSDYNELTIISHNDVIFHKDKNEFNFYQYLGKNDIGAFINPIVIKESEKLKYCDLLKCNVLKYENYKCKKFIKKHFHTGILVTSKKFKIKFRDFFLNNIDEILKQQNKFKFIEQELLTIFAYGISMKDISIIDNKKIEGKGHRLGINDKYIHFDHKHKGFGYLDFQNKDNITKSYKLKHAYIKLVMEQLEKIKI